MTSIAWKQPDPFSFVAEEWPAWREIFESFRSCTKLYTENATDQINTLYYTMGAVEAKKIAATFKFEGKYLNGGEEKDEKADDFDCIMHKFTQYFVPTKMRRYERARFNERRQKDGEQFENFLRDCYALIKKCEYKDEEEMMLDKIVQGITHKPTRDKLELMPNLTLPEAIKIIRRQEMLTNQEKVVSEVMSKETPSSSRGRGSYRGHGQHRSRGRSHNSSRVHTGNRGRGHTSNRGRGDFHSRGNNGNTGTSRGHGKCGRCGFTYHKNISCPAISRECRACNKIGHFESMCRQKRQDEVVYDQFSSADDAGQTEEYFIGTVTCSDHDDAWFVSLPICGSQVKFKIDTGADISIITQRTFETLARKPTLLPSNALLCSPGGKIEACGEISVVTTHKDSEYKFKIVIISGETGTNLLSRSVATQMGLIKRADSVKETKSNEIGLMKTSPIKIHIREDVTPVCRAVARRIPFPLMNAVRNELDRMIENDVIEKVTEPTEWCSAMVPVTKKNGKVRICVDLKDVNKAVKRPHYSLPTFDDIAPKLAGSTVFSTLDAASGFWQIPLHKESQPLTTFITPFGRFMFKRLPFGINLATDEYQKRMIDIFGNQDGVEVIVDDILVHGRDRSEHDRRLDAVMNKIKEVGLRLNNEKCKFRMSEVTYFGHLVGKDGVKPHPDKIQAIAKLDSPSNVSELRTVLGMINYLTKFVPDIATVLKPMTQLLRSDTAWVWGPEQDRAFENAKKLICEATSLRFYDPKKPVTVTADASSYGLGACILQKENDKWLPVAFCSRTLTPAEQRYPMVEKECLALVWACERFAHYLVGLPSFVLLTDHKPLVPILTKKSIDEVPLRCQRLILRLMRFNPEVKYVPGKEQYISDALSRNPLPLNPETDNELSNAVQVHVDAVISTWSASNERKCQISTESEADEDLQIVRKYIENGWPAHVSSIPERLRPYYSARDELSITDGFVVYADRIVIPTKLRAEIMSKLHESHQGLNKCLDNAQMTVWWPGITSQMSELIKNCTICAENKPAQRSEPLIPSKLPERPWQVVASDLFELNNKHYLIVVDKYSRWIEIKSLSSTKAQSVVKCMKNIFAVHGIPETVQSDNGPQYTSMEYRDFARTWGFDITTSSPHFPQANGAAERSVQIAKKILSQTDPELAMLNYRNTPHSATGISPAEALMGRKLRTRIPVLSKLLIPRAPDKDIMMRDEAAKQSYKLYYDRRTGARPLPPLDPGQPVMVRRGKEENTHGIVQTGCREKRTYIIKTPQGVIRRNRKHLHNVPFYAERHDVTMEDFEENDNVNVNKENTKQVIKQQNFEMDMSIPVRKSARVIKRPARLIEEK